MFIKKRKHEQQISALEAKLAESITLSAQLEARAIKAEQSALKLVEQMKQRLLDASEFSSIGEAAYAYADEFDECKPEWSDANQDLWDTAACGAILFAQQHAAEAQIAFFKLGACVPYALSGDDQDQVMSARLVDPTHGGIDISVNGKYLRTIDIYGGDSTVQWFSNLVTSPPGYLGV